MTRAILAALCLALSLPALAQPLSGPAVVIDGDTLSIAGQRVRLHGIDAPELRQTCEKPRSFFGDWRFGASNTYECGRDAAAVLAELTRGQTVMCHPTGRDRYGRIVADCTVWNANLGAMMVRRGWAIDVPRYSRGAYAGYERDAKAERAGMWAGEFVEPAAWRRSR